MLWWSKNCDSERAGEMTSVTAIRRDIKFTGLDSTHLSVPGEDAGSLRGLPGEFSQHDFWAVEVEFRKARCPVHPLFVDR
jgi:hypothetical protein